MGMHTLARNRWARSTAFAALILTGLPSMAQPGKTQEPAGVLQQAKQQQSELKAPVGTYKRQRANGTVEEEVINASSGGRAVLRQLRYYDDGKVRQQLEWASGKLNGTSRVYNPDGSVFREAEYQNDQILSFAEYRQKLVYNQITKDSRTVVHRGKRIPLRWDKYYEVLQKDRRMMGYTRDALIIFLLANGTTEQATQTLSDLNSLYQSKASGALADANAVVACENGKSGVANDLGLNNSTFRNASAAKGNKTGATTTGRAAMATVNDAVNNLTSACGSGTSGAGTGRLPGTSTPRDLQIAAAQGALDQAIQQCKAGSPGVGNDLISIGPGTGFKSIGAAIEAAEAAIADTQIVRAGAAAAESGSAIVEGSVVESSIVRAAAAATESGSTVVRGFVLAGPLAEVAAVAAVGLVVGLAEGYLIHKSPIGDAITAVVAAGQEHFDANYQEEAKKADEAQKAAAARDAEKKTGSTPPAGPSVATPSPDSQGRDKCAQLEDFKNNCEMSGWATRQCAAFVAINAGCRGDARQVQFSDESGTAAVACPAQRSEAERQALQVEQNCAREGLIGQPSPDSAGCGSRSVDSGPIRQGPNPNQINPPRGE